MDMRQIREENLKIARSLGYPINESLPVLDEVQQIRSLAEATERLLCLYAIVACSYGFPKEQATKWLTREGVVDYLAESEKEYLESNSSKSVNAEKQWLVESLWALAWCVGCHDNLDFSDSCSDNFVQMLPDIAKDAATISFRTRLHLRTESEIAEKTDLAYCLHWAVRNADIKGRKPPGAVPGRVIVERRRTLEWIISQDRWDKVTLDT